VSVTIINGGTQGLGEAVARRLVEQGATGLVLGGRSADRGEALAAELTELGTPTIFHHSDMSDPTAPAQLVDACVERFGAPTGLVNVAATTSRANLFTDTPEHFDKQFALNVKAPYFLIQAAATAMLRASVRGSIVNVGSTAGHGGATKLTAYSMSKGALAIMTKNLAFGLMQHGIRVNQVNPGWMDTESEHRVQVDLDGAPENWLEIAEANSPLGRIVKPWEVANAIAFCLSDESGMMTGNCIDIDRSVHGAGDLAVPTPADAIWPEQND
jgi:NAD(P)-dependent dehydrogenase (short-subunit alcohol dehydrogenase family)